MKALRISVLVSIGIGSSIFDIMFEISSSEGLYSLKEQKWYFGWGPINITIAIFALSLQTNLFIVFKRE